MSHIELPALDGRNPLGFLATLGLHHLVGTHADHDATLAWHPATCLPTLGTTRFTDLDELATWLVELATGQPDDVLQPGWPPGFPPPGEAPDKLVPLRSEFRKLLEQHNGAKRLIGALVTDLAVNDVDRVRRTPMVAPTGKQSFSTMLNNQAGHVRADPQVLRQALVRWRRIRGTTGEGFDGAAIVGGADDPTGRPGERAVPGAVWLAIAGLARYRLAADDRGRTTATAWRRVKRTFLMVWPLWTPDLDAAAILVLLEHPTVALSPGLHGTLTPPPASHLTPLGVAGSAPPNAPEVETPTVPSPRSPCRCRDDLRAVRYTLHPRDPLAPRSDPVFRPLTLPQRPNCGSPISAARNDLHYRSSRPPFSGSPPRHDRSIAVPGACHPASSRRMSR